MPARLGIEGGERLRGEVAVSAAKNAALPALCAALLTPEPVVLENVPRLADVTTTCALLERLGAQVNTDADRATRVRVERVTSHEAPYELSRRWAVWGFVPARLLPRRGVARWAFRGGVATGVGRFATPLKDFLRSGATLRARKAPC